MDETLKKYFLLYKLFYFLHILMSDLENLEHQTNPLDNGEKNAVELIAHGPSDVVDQAIWGTPELSVVQKNIEQIKQQETVRDAMPQLLLGDILNQWQQLTYLPLSVDATSGTALLPAPPIGCCGLGYNMVGLRVSQEWTRDDYFANKNYWRTFDGKGVDAVWARWSGHYTWEVSWWTSRHNKEQDPLNKYKANFARLTTAHGISFTNADARVVPYIQAQWGYMWTFMEGQRAGQAFVYDKGNLFVWAQAWVRLNIAEILQLWVFTNRNVVPSGALDNFPGWSKKADHLYGVGVHLYYIIP